MVNLYQVAVWLEGDKKSHPSIQFTDLSKSELRRKVVRPYNRGAKIFEGSNVFDLSKTSGVKILHTNLHAAELVKAANDKFNKGIQDFNTSNKNAFIFSLGRAKPWDVEGVEVTKNFIVGPPGRISTARRLVENPWTLMIGGLAGTALLAYLGLS